MLYSLGALVMDVHPFNVDSIERETGADFAVKEVVGTMKPREFVGEADETIVLSGNLFPHFMQAKTGQSGLTELDLLHKMRQSGEPYILTRGDGLIMGPYLIEHVVERGRVLDPRGVARHTRVDIHLVKSAVRPSPFSLGDVIESIADFFMLW